MTSSKWQQVVLAVVLAISCAVGAHAQTTAGAWTAPETDAASALGHMAKRAGSVFVGSVGSIVQRGGAVEIEINVEVTLAGTPSGVYTMREWAGLWLPGQPRYRVGQRAMFFVLPVSDAGLSSPVDGADGIVPVSGDPTDQRATVDLRRLNARLLRSVGQPLSTDGSAKLGDVVQTVARALESTRTTGAVGGGPRPIAVRPSGGANR